MPLVEVVLLELMNKAPVLLAGSACRHANGPCGLALCGLQRSLCNAVLSFNIKLCRASGITSLLAEADNLDNFSIQALSNFQNLTHYQLFAGLYPTAI